MRSTAVARARQGVRGVLCAGLWLAATVHAAPVAPGSEPSASSTGLASAVRAAWTTHPAADAAEHTLAAARARADAASRPLYNPDLELAVDDEGGERTSTAGLAWTLDLSGKRAARAALGSAELTRAEAEAALRRSAFARQWLLAWATHAAARERVRVGEQRLALVQRFAELAERQLAVGDISPLERDLALLARDEAQAEQATWLGDAAEAAEALRAVGGPATDAALPPAPPAWPDAAPLRLAAIPEARIAAATTVSAERRIAIAQRDRRPDPTISIGAGRVDTGPASGNVIGVSISVPLMVRNTYRAERAAAEADALAAAAEQRRIALELEARATRTVDTYAAMREAWERWVQSPGTDAGKRADLLERLWRAGELSTADYLIQLEQTLDTALAGADLQGRLWRSYVEALYATGRLDAWVGFDPITAEVSR